MSGMLVIKTEMAHLSKQVDQSLSLTDALSKAVNKVEQDCESAGLWQYTNN